MQTAISYLLFFTFTSLVLAAPPKQPNVNQFQSLWKNSPFTVTPKKTPFKQANSLEREWMLGSIRPVGDAYAVTLINKKDRKKRIRFLPGFPSDGFQLVQVQQDTQDYKKSRVHIRKGTQSAWISYDPKFIEIETPAQEQEKPPAIPQKSRRFPLNKSPDAIKPKIPKKPLPAHHKNKKK